MDPNVTSPAAPETAPEPPHAPGQVIGPNAPPPADVIGPEIPASPMYAEAELPHSNDNPMDSSETPERPLGVILPEQAMGGVINGQVIGQNDSKSSKKRRFSKHVLILAIAVPLILLGGSAAAYFGYYVPNNPDNVLAKAVSNTLAEQQITTTGSLDSSSGGVASHIEYIAATNEATHAVDLKLNATISGVKIPLELVIVNKNLYFKVGDLSSLEGLLSQFAGSNNAELKTLEDQINKTITNQWIEVDSTLIKEAKLDCLSNYPASFSQTDIQSLEKSYKTNAFVTITSHSTEKLNGASAIKYQLSIDDNNLATFNLNSSGYFKQLNDCLKKTNPSSSLSLNSLNDGDKTPITIWVDKASKRVVKYSAESTAKDKSNGTEAKVSGTVTYQKVNITAPANAKPVLNLINDLGLGSYLGSNGVTGLSATGTGQAAKDTERKTDINTLHSQLEVYNAENGYYPTLSNLNDPVWRTQNMKGLDSTVLKDPDGIAQKLATTPAAHVYSYQAAPSGCDNVKIQCTSYTLSATLSDGTVFSKKSLN